MPPHRRILSATAIAAATLVSASSADAATVATLPCVPVASGVQSMPITATGFTPGSLVTIRTANSISPTPKYLTSGTADASGNFAATVFPPTFDPFSRLLQTFNLGAGESVNPANVAIATYQQVVVGYKTNPETGRPTRQATHTVRGFPVGKTTYLHFRFAGKTRRNVKLGRTSAPCGIVSKRMRLLPTQSRPGKWTVYVDQSKAYHKTTKPQLKYSFVITRTFGT